MTIRRRLFAAPCFLGVFSAHAQETWQRPDTNGWQTGAIALVRSGGYINDANRTLVVPAVGYEGFNARVLWWSNDLADYY